MNREAAEKLKDKDRVIFKNGAPEACTGTVIETGYCAVKIKWDDGIIGIVRHEDGHMADIAPYSGDDTIVPPTPV